MDVNLAQDRSETLLRRFHERRSADSLSERLRRVDGVLEHLPDEVCFITADDLRVRTANAAARDNLGYTPEELRGMPLTSLQTEFSLEELQALFEPLKRGRKHEIHYETWHQRHDGSTYAVDVRVRHFSQGPMPQFIAVMNDIEERSQHARRAERLARRLRELSATVMQVQEHERRHLARELHDEIGQSLTAATITLHALKDGGGEELFKELEQLLTGVLTQVRDLSLALRPSLLDDMGIEAALRWYLLRQAQRAGFTAGLEVTGLGGRLPTELETAAFRIVQEAVTNIVRHAGASKVDVKITLAQKQLEIEIRDDGRGFDPAAAQRNAGQGNSFGVLGMRERAQLCGGDLWIESAPGQGTRVLARLPATAAPLPATKEL